jgi:hypothetical protein
MKGDMERHVNMHEREVHAKFLSQYLKGRDHLEDLGIEKYVGECGLDLWVP